MPHYDWRDGLTALTAIAGDRAGIDQRDRPSTFTVPDGVPRTFMGVPVIEDDNLGSGGYLINGDAFRDPIPRNHMRVLNDDGTHTDTPNPYVTIDHNMPAGVFYATATNAIDPGTILQNANAAYRDATRDFLERIQNASPGETVINRGYHRPDVAVTDDNRWTTYANRFAGRWTGTATNYDPSEKPTPPVEDDFYEFER